MQKSQCLALAAGIFGFITSACDVPDSASWDVIVCTDSVGCLARPTGGSLWVHAIADCELDEAIEAGDLVPVEPPAGCSHPVASFLPETRCFYSTKHEIDVCYTGDSVVWTQAVGACDMGLEGERVDPLVDAWDAVNCERGPCYGVSDTAVHLVRTEQWVSEQPPGELPVCAR